jgi:23S rRNA pseudouridine955/2504/2580 synthase
MVEQASEDVRTFTIAPDDDGIRLDRWFKRHMPDIPFGLVSRWVRTGQVRVDGGRAKVGDHIAQGQELRVPPAEPPSDAPVRRGREPLSPEEADFARDMVIFEDEHAFVVNKPPGLATQGGTKTTRHLDGMLDALVPEGSEQRPRLVHRLDKDTSGAVLLARTPGSAAYFSKHFATRKARKIYWALVMGVPDISDGIIELPLAKQPGTGGEKMHVDEENGQPSKTRYRVIERAGNRAAWVELQPYTGRTHQLRVHMAAIGHPIVGDGKYGSKEAFLTGSISRKMHLHARRLKIGGPKGSKIDVLAELPEHFAESMEQLGFDQALGDLPFDDGPPEAPPEVKKQKARQHAKQIRKERRGERRERGSSRNARK